MVTTVEEVIVLVNLEEGWLDKFLGFPTHIFAKVLTDIANCGKDKTTATKNAMKNGLIFPKDLAFAIG